MLKCMIKEEIIFYIEALDKIEDETIKKSLKKDLKWYCSKTTCSKRLLLVFTFLTISIPAITPVMNSIFKSEIVVNCIAASNTIVSSWLAFKNYKMSWARYGQTSEDIKREIRCAITRTGRYSEITDRNKLEKALFYNVEMLTNIENENWNNYIIKKEDSIDKKSIQDKHVNK